MLATVLMVDVVGSTPLAHSLGDRRRQELLEEYYRDVRLLLARFRGQEIQTAGDGFWSPSTDRRKGVTGDWQLFRADA